MWQGDVELLICPDCRGALVVSLDEGMDGVLSHARGSCPEAYPVIGGIPRLLLGSARHELAAAHRTWFRAHPSFHGWSSERIGGADLQLVRRFDDEWQQFAEMASNERRALFAGYFDLIPEERLGPGSTVLDAGCGGGRWAAEVAQRGARVIALDLGRSVEVAARHAGAGTACVQADVRDIPIAPAAVDVAYSLGVLHHVEDTDLAVRQIVKAVRPGGLFLIYLYYALDGRGPLFRALFGAVTSLRTVIAALPQPLAVMVTTLIAVIVYLPFARLARILDMLGLATIADRLPLRFYSTLSFRTMRNDSLDRFGTKLEKRFRREEVVALLQRAGLVDIRVSPEAPYWHAVGRRPG